MLIGGVIIIKRYKCALFKCGSHSRLQFIEMKGEVPTSINLKEEVATSTENKEELPTSTKAEQVINLAFEH